MRPAKRFFREVDERSETGLEELLSVSHITGVTPRREKNVSDANLSQSIQISESDDPEAAGTPCIFVAHDRSIAAAILLSEHAE